MEADARSFERPLIDERGTRAPSCLPLLAC
jgi:hypothetical protein